MFASLVVLFGAVFIVGLFSMTVKYADRMGANSAVNHAGHVVPATIQDMERTYGNGGGHYCGHCGVSGSHVTSRHNEFATHVINL